MAAIAGSSSGTKPLAGQVALVTGGGRGLGRAMALALAEAGMAVAVIARTASELGETVALIEAQQGKALAVTASVTDDPAVQQAVQEVERQWGPLDLLINNAGVVDPLGPLWEVDADEWWRCFEVNVRGALLCSKAVLPSMLRRQHGRIVNIVSGAGLQGIANGSAYVVSKTALIRLTENLALEAGDAGIRVFAVDPGTVRMGMAEYLYNSEAARHWLPWFPGILDQGLDDPIERLAEVVLALACGEADALSGCVVSVKDNLTTMIDRAARIAEDELYTLRLHRLNQE